MIKFTQNKNVNVGLPLQNKKLKYITIEGKNNFFLLFNFNKPSKLGKIFPEVNFFQASDNEQLHVPLRLKWHCAVCCSTFPQSREPSNTLP